MDNVSITFDTSAFEGAINTYATGIGDSVRPAAQEAAQILYDEAKLRCKPGKAEVHYFFGTSFKKSGIFYGQDGGTKLGPTRPFYSGNLRDSIYQVYSKDNSLDNKIATYHVSWNAKKAPYGHMVENGTSRTKAQPFIRPAFDAKRGEMETAIRTRMEQGMQQVIAGLTS